MNDMLQRKGVLRAVGTSLLLAVVMCGRAIGQQPAPQIQVSGTVTSTTGEKIPGVIVRIRGTTTSTVADANGKYSITAPADGVLTFGLIGFRSVGANIGGRTTIDVSLERAINVLPEVVVTGYTSQRRQDITGAVGSVEMSSVQRQTSASVLQRLDGKVTGVTVENGGSPGSRSTVRIRGISSFQNNDPLYVIDGTPTQDSYLNWLSANDVASIEVLKDASSASIYGSRASNGVVVVESKKGRPGRRQFTLDVKTGVANPVHGYDDILTLDALQYFGVVKAAYQNAGQAVPINIYGSVTNPTIPQYIYPNNCINTDSIPIPCGNVNPSAYNYPNSLIMAGSPGTNWWKAVYGSAATADAYLGVSGGGEDNAYHVSFNYYNQNGTAAYNRYTRGTVRINTAFTLDRVNVGENIGLSGEQYYGGLTDDPPGYAEDGILGKNILMQPVVPIYDISGTHFASGKAVGLGNQSNPLGYAYNRKDDRNSLARIFGNVYGGLDLSRKITFKTLFGFNVGQQSFKGFTPPRPEDAEATSGNALTQTYANFAEWTWSNTLRYAGASGRHNIAVLLGQEANRNDNTNITGGINNLINTATDSRYITDVLGVPSTKTVNSTASVGTLLSIFGKADYNFAEKYFVSFTLRRDGSSRLGPDHRWGTFPAVGVGWRLSQESFLSGSDLFSNAMLRFGWGITGNQNIPNGRTVDLYGGENGDTFYDIGGTGSIQTGYRLQSLGNPDLKWEENKSVNLGFDVELKHRTNISVDVYNRTTDNLLFPPALPATAGVANPPYVNIGKMRNRGIEVSLGYNGTIGEGKLWNMNLTATHYNNEILQIDGVSTSFFGPIATRNQNAVINQVGQPIGSFFGLQANGYYTDSLDAAQCGTGDPLGKCWDDGARPGRIKFVDVNGDHHITAADRVVIGSPHPDLTAGLDLGLRWGQFDVSATFFGSFGNKIFDVQKYWYVFRVFDTNVRNDLLTNSATLDGQCNAVPPPPGSPTGTPGTYPCPGKLTNPGAKYPRVDVSDDFSKQYSSYYIEDGTYVRLRSLQIAYNVPAGWVRWIPAARIYVQAENLFTITGYEGLDPSLPAANIQGNSQEDLRDQYRGVDRGSYPSNRLISFGISTSF